MPLTFIFQISIIDVAPEGLYRNIKHIGIIPDGNRRFAKQNGMPPWKGHEKGIEQMREVADHVFGETKVQYLTFYGFSSDNFNRPPEEKKQLFGYMAKALDELSQLEGLEGVGLQFMGDLRRFNEYQLPGKMEGGALTLKDLLELKERDSEKGRWLTILMGYDYKEEEKLADQRIKELSPHNYGMRLNRDHFGYDWGKLPEFDVIIRTGGENPRLSGFPARLIGKETGLFFPKYLWPEFGVNQLKATCLEYLGIDQRHGR